LEKKGQVEKATGGGEGVGRGKGLFTCRIRGGKISARPKKRRYTSVGLGSTSGEGMAKEEVKRRGFPRGPWFFKEL